MDHKQETAMLAELSQEAERIGFTVPEGASRTRVRRAISIGECLQQEPDIQKAADYMGMATQTIERYVADFGIEISSETAPEPEEPAGNDPVFIEKAARIYQQRAGRIAAAFTSGAVEVKDIAQITGYPLSFVAAVCRSQEIKVRHPRTDYTHDRLKDRLVRRGLPLKAIAGKAGCTKEWVRIYVEKMGMYDAYRQSRQHYDAARKQTHEVMSAQHLHMQRLASSLLSAIPSIAPEEDVWAVQKAFEDRSDPAASPQRYSFDKAFTILTAYKHARDQGEKPSYTQLARETGTSVMGMSKFLKRLGLPSLNWTVEKRDFMSPDQKQALKRTQDSCLTNPDLAYLIRTTPANIVNHRDSDPEKARDGKILCIYQGGRPYVLNYRLSSQIYRADDLGFSTHEIAELLDTVPDIVAYATDNRDEIGGNIIKILETAYQKHFENPYFES
ncbi:hypothetical protein GF351_06455 [Candidatus Woesearchaeota archaeon]|nr:hypothetical protein [Candidatus Woesearchaeota archaeon]